MWRACVALEDSLDTKVETWAENLCGRDKRALRHAQVGPPAPHFPSGSRAQRRARSLVYTFRDGKCREPQHELMEDKEIPRVIPPRHNFAPLRTTILRLASACSLRRCGGRDVMRCCRGKEAHSTIDASTIDASAGAASDSDGRSALYRLPWGWSAVPLHEGPERPRRPRPRWRVHLLDRRRSVNGEGGAMRRFQRLGVRKCRTLVFGRCTVIT